MTPRSAPCGGATPHGADVANVLASSSMAVAVSTSSGAPFVAIPTRSPGMNSTRPVVSVLHRALSRVPTLPLRGRCTRKGEPSHATPSRRRELSSTLRMSESRPRQTPTDEPKPLAFVSVVRARVNLPAAVASEYVHHARRSQSSRPAPCKIYRPILRFRSRFSFVGNLKSRLYKTQIVHHLFPRALHRVVPPPCSVVYL